jgi:two-component system OmpR family sensor kinase
MHELKTPITKGKFLIELPRNEHNQNKMREVFYRLENLINESALIESFISTKNVLKLKKYYLRDIVDSAIDILMCDEDAVIKDFDDKKIVFVDFKLFSTTMKNLIDNAIKYSPDKKVTVTLEGNAIIIKNQGEKLSLPFEKYCDPFFQDKSSEQNGSFGLGLYIVKNIIYAHSWTLTYNYRNGVHMVILTPPGNVENIKH